MPDYLKGCVYMIKKQNDFNNDNVYIGSTCNFTRRKNQHKSSCNNENSKQYNYKLYQYIRQNGCWNSWCMTKIIDCPCNNKSELNIMERNCIDDYKSKLNCSIPMRTDKEWRNDNKEKISQYGKEWYNDNKEKISKYYIDNKEKIKQYGKEWYNDNKEKLAQKQKEYRKDNKEKIAQKHKEYRKDNKEKIAQYIKKWSNDNKEKIAQYSNDNKEKIVEKKKQWYNENRDKILEKVICDNCGCEILKNNLSRHKRNVKCLNFQR
jgi:hypothetical protein